MCCQNENKYIWEENEGRKNILLCTKDEFCVALRRTQSPNLVLLQSRRGLGTKSDGGNEDPRSHELVDAGDAYTESGLPLSSEPVREF